MSFLAKSSYNYSPHFKVLMLGYYACGKTSLLSRFSQKMFEPEYHMTLSTSNATRLVQIQGNLSVKLQLIDTPGSVLVKKMINNIVPQFQVLLLVYDLTNQQSFYRIAKWQCEISEMTKKEVLVVLVGTHLDQPYKRKVSYEEANKWRKNCSIPLFFEISNKTNQNISEMFEEMVRFLLMRCNQKYDSRKLDFVNPQSETTFEQDKGLGYNRNGKVALLQKKLQFKQNQCAKLWQQYEEALNRISELESMVHEVNPNSSFLGSYKTFSSDSEDLQNKVRSLQQNLRALEDHYSSKQSDLQESFANKIGQIRLKNQQLNNQIQELNELTRLQTQMIKSIQKERDEFIIKFNSATYDVEQKEKEFNEMLGEIVRINSKVQNRTMLLQLTKNIALQDVFRFKSTKMLYINLQTLLEYLDQKEKILLQLDFQLKKERQINQQALKQKQQEIKSLKEELDQYGQLIEQYEQKAADYRGEVLRKKQLQIQLKNKELFIVELENDFKIKTQEFVQFIAQKEKAIGLFVQNIKILQSKLALQQKQNSKLTELLQEKTQLLTKNENILARIANQKINEVNQLKTFIEQLGKNSKNLVSKYSNNMDKLKQVDSQKQQNEQTIKFAQQLLNKIKHKSTSMNENLCQIFNSLTEVKQSVTQIKQIGQKLQITDYIFQCKDQWDHEEKQRQFDAIKQEIQQSQFKDNPVLENLAIWCDSTLKAFKNWQFCFWYQLRGQSSVRVARLLTSLSQLQNRMQSCSQTFRQNLGQIAQNISLIQGVTQSGLVQYSKLYFN